MGNLEGSFLVLKRFRDAEVQWTGMGKLYFSRAEKSGVLDKSRAKE